MNPVEEVKNQRPLRCVVTSDKMDKSRVGAVERQVQHPLVRKHIRRTTKMMFHDPENQTKIGDHVLITPCRPLSANKSYKLLQVVKRGKD
ncbi:MAG: 30S ribosomal protein S17 [Oligoflexales bacterium]